MAKDKKTPIEEWMEEYLRNHPIGKKNTEKNK